MGILNLFTISKVCEIKQSVRLSRIFRMLLKLLRDWKILFKYSKNLRKVHLCVNAPYAKHIQVSNLLWK